MYTETNEFGVTRIYPWLDSEAQLRQKPFSGNLDIVPSENGGNAIRLGQWYLDAESARKLAEAICAAADMLEDNQ